MAENKKLNLDPGFEEVPLDEGFEEIPLNQPKTASGTLGQKASDLGEALLESGKGALKTGVESMSDIGRGAFQGLSAGTSDEALAAIKASIPGRSEGETGEEDWKTLYRKYQAEEQAKNTAAKERSPYLYGGAEIGGLVAPALLTAGATAPVAAGRLTAMALAKKAGAAAATGAATGAVMGATMSEKGKLIGATPEEEEKLKADIIGGTVTGGVVGGALGTAVPLVKSGYKAIKEKVSNKLENYISDSPFWSQAAKSKQLGEEGVDIFSEKAAQGPIGETSGLIHQDTNATRDLVNRIYAVDSKLGQKVGESIDNATDQGITVDLTEPMLNSVNTFKNLLNNDQTLLANPKAQKLYDTIFQMGDFDAGSLTPKEVQSLRNSVVDFADSIKQKDPGVASLGYQFQKQIGDLLKEAVPEYKISSERFEQFRRLVPETLISGATPVDISQVKLGNLKNDEAKLFSSAKNMIQGARMPGTGAGNAKETFKNLVNGVDTFEKSELQRARTGQIDLNEKLPKLVENQGESQAQGLQKQIKDRADQSALLQQAWRVNPQESAATATKGSMFGRGSIMNFANKYGLYKDTLTKPIAAPVKLTQKLYNASEDELKGIAQKMSEIPGLASVGKTLLKGLENKDIAGVNAAIFSIMQNPQARILINAEDIEAEKKE